MSESFSESPVGRLSIRAATNEDCGVVRDLVFGVLREFGLEPETEGIDRDLDDIVANYIDRGGSFEVLEDESGKILGTVGLFPTGEGEVELRKMYFDPSLRGKGIGRKLLGRTVEKAENLGFRRIELETASVLKAAISLYSSFGFKVMEGGHADRCDLYFYLDLREDARTED